jgi:hypothetical protein
MSPRRGWGLHVGHLLQTWRPAGAGGYMWAICYRHVAPPGLGGSIWAICYRHVAPPGLGGSFGHLLQTCRYGAFLAP